MDAWGASGLFTLRTQMFIQPEGFTFQDLRPQSYLLTNGMISKV
jgi:hypothetical protein